MSGRGDHVPEMPSVPLLGDTTIDAILDGGPVPRGMEHIGAFAAGVRAVGERPPPRPSPQLAALLAHGTPAAAPGRATYSLTARHRPTRAGRLRFAMKVGAATTAAIASLAGAAAAGILPGDTDAPVRKAIEELTPVEFTDDGGSVDDSQNGGAGDLGGDSRDVDDHADEPADADGQGEDTDAPGADDAQGEEGPADNQAPPAERGDDRVNPANENADDPANGNAQQGAPPEEPSSDRNGGPTSDDQDG